MPQQVRGVIATGNGEPVSIETIVVPDPGPGEVVVDVQACGVCHTDLHDREGGIGVDFPSRCPWDPTDSSQLRSAHVI
jgi:S-(hydroxymethyl)mycothiol dehydrogenase